MIPDDTIGQQLHDRDTRGKPLTDDERSLLDSWYAKNEQEDLVRFSVNWNRELESLREQNRIGLEQLDKAVHLIQKMTGDNEKLDQEIQSLRLRLARKPQKV